MASKGPKAEPTSVHEDELPDFDEDDNKADGEGQRRQKADGGDIRASGFKDFLLKSELNHAITECGFEHPSEVQHACIPQAVLGTDVLCQAKSGMGKTAVFVLACIQAVDFEKKALKALVLCHSRELAYQIKHEFSRLGKKMEAMKVEAVYGGSPIAKDREMLKAGVPHILVGTPGRVLQLVKEKAIVMDELTHFILDECDRCLDLLDMRADVQKIFIQTPKKKQVMMFSATISPETRLICKKFMKDPHEITVESEAKLTLHGLLQYYVKMEEKKKNKKLIDLLDELEFNQVVIFVSSVKRALALDGLLQESSFPSMTLHPMPNEFKHKMPAGEKDPGNRIDRFKAFKDFQKRILVATDLFGRGIDVERVNIVINYDMPKESDMYLHRVGRAGRFGTKGLAITFASTEEDMETLEKVQSRFEVNIASLPEKIDTTSYLNA